MLKALNPRLRIGSTLLILFIIIGLVMPWFAPKDPRPWNSYQRNLTASQKHWLGTTSLGQDTFWFLTWAMRSSLALGIVVAVVANVIGIVIGLTAGFRGGMIDRFLTLWMDALIIIPSLPILILLGSLMQGRGTLVVIGAVLTLFTWPWPARQARAVALTMRERDFINTAWFSGENGFKIITQEIFPYLTGWAMSSVMNGILAAIGSESGLAIIGLSSLTDATLGTMIYWAIQRQALLSGRWLWIGAPVVSLMLLFIGLFLTATGFQDYSAKRRGR